MDKLIFLSNNLIDPLIRRKMRIPLEFISFGITDGKMYSYLGNKSTFIVPLGLDKEWGNSVVYGAIFLCKNFDFYSRLLDAHHVCSVSTMYVNNKYDLQHRVIADVTPIFFNSVDEFIRLKYRESTPQKMFIYVGNTTHPKITKRINSSRPHRIVDGIEINSYRNLIREVLPNENV